MSDYFVSQSWAFAILFVHLKHFNDFLMCVRVIFRTCKKFIQNTRNETHTALIFILKAQFKGVKPKPVYVAF